MTTREELWSELGLGVQDTLEGCSLCGWTEKENNKENCSPRSFLLFLFVLLLFCITKFDVFSFLVC